MATKIKQSPKVSKRSSKGVKNAGGSKQGAAKHLASHAKPSTVTAKRPATKHPSIDLKKGVPVREYPKEGSRKFDGVKVVGHSG